MKVKNYFDKEGAIVLLQEALEFRQAQYDEDLVRFKEYEGKWKTVRCLFSSLHYSLVESIISKSKTQWENKISDMVDKEEKVLEFEYIKKHPLIYWLHKFEYSEISQKLIKFKGELSNRSQPEFFLRIVNEEIEAVKKHPNINIKVEFEEIFCSVASYTIYPSDYYTFNTPTFIASTSFKIDNAYKVTLILQEPDLILEPSRYCITTLTTALSEIHKESNCVYLEDDVLKLLKVD